MRLALLGTGKTGSMVAELYEGPMITSFNSSTPITVDALKAHSVVISFLPGDAFNEHLEVLFESRVPVVSGSTGDIDLKAIDQELIARELCWVYASNFSLSMCVLKTMIERLGRLSQLNGFKFALEETHHVNKVDAPSGTAKSWRSWLGQESLEIRSERREDVVGIHSVTAESKFERITLEHEAYDRSLFAQGALWAAEKLISTPEIQYGLTSFQDLVLGELFKEES